MENPTEKLCNLIAGLRYEDLGADTIARVKDAIGDGLSVTVAGSTERPVAILADYVRSLECAPVATVWGHGFRTSPVSAVLVNAAAAHVLDYEPMSSPSMHVVSPVVPVVLTLAETRDCTGRDVVTACAKAFEIQHRLLYAGNMGVRGKRPFHQLGFAGVMGAAVAAAHVLELDAAQLRNALGTAASRAGSLLANGGSMTKCTHAGNAAAGGLEAALLALRGFDANPEILAHPQGYNVAFLGGDAFDYERLLAFGKPFRIVDPGMAYKFFPSKYPTQFVLTAALELHPKIGKATQIARVRVTTPVMRDVDRPQPRSGLEGKFSFQYTAAVALLDGEIDKASFSDERRFRTDMVELLPKIEVTQSPDIPVDFRQMHVTVEVEMRDGARHTTTCSKPKGAWGVKIEPDEHWKKMRDCMSGIMSEGKARECFDTVMRLEAVDAAGVRKLIQSVSRGPAEQK